jgi:hypothetical protein
MSTSFGPQPRHVEGPDVSRAAAARGAAEAVWVPTSVLPRYAVEWFADGDHHIRATWMIDGQPFSTRYSPEMINSDSLGIASQCGLMLIRPWRSVLELRPDL